MPPAIAASLRQRLLDEARAALLVAVHEALQACGIRQPEPLGAARAAAKDCFDELASLKDIRDFERSRGLTASRISLVHEDDLEFTIRLADLAKDLREACGSSLGDLQQRFVVLLEQVDVAEEQTPVGPDAALAAVRAMVDVMQLDSEQRLSLLARSKIHFITSLKACYSALNESFEAAGIRRNLARPIGHATPGSAAGGALHQLQQRLVARSPATLDQLDAGLSSALREQVTKWLMEQQGARAGKPANAPLAGFSGGQLAALLTPESRAALEAIELFFTALFAEDSLAQVFKGILGRLQIPMLRAALLDDSVITDINHPVRRLIDCLGDLAGNQQLNNQDFRYLHSVIDKLEDQQNIDANSFTEAANALDGLLNRQIISLNDQVESCLEAALREEKRELGVDAASNVLKRLWAPDLPVQINSFLQTYWVKLLVSAHMARGERSELWAQLVTTAELLVESVRAIDEPADKAAMLQGLPGLARQLDASLAAGGMSEPDRRAALQPCMALHAAIMNGRMPPPAQALAPRPELRWRAAPRAPKLRIGRAPEILIDEKHPGGLVHKDIHVGAGLHCELPDLGARTGTIAWIGPERRVLLWLCPGVAGVFLLPMRWLGSALQNRQAHLLAEEPLFEKLARNALVKG